MSVSVVRLRRWLLVGASLLVIVIAAFLGYAHYLKSRFLAGVSGTMNKLGIDVKQDSNGVTFSNAAGSRTTYTIHASNEVQLKDGKMTLHDVGIVFYGRQGDRADRMWSDEADFDQNAGEMRAAGEVHLDLQAATAGGAKVAPVKESEAERHQEAAPGGKDDRVIHVTMHGLVFLQKMGIAATDKEIEFQVKGMTGHAVGGEYNTDTGIVVLQSAVKVVGLQNGKPVELTSARAVIDRKGQKAMLTQAKYTGMGNSGPVSAEARDALITLRPDGSVEKIDANGDVTLLEPGSGRTLHAAKMQAQLNEKGVPKAVRGFGGLHFVDDELLRKGDGVAVEGQMLFDAAGKPQHLTTSGAVRVTERQRASQTAPWKTRTMSSETAEAEFVSVAGCSQPQVREVRANGGARLTLETVKAASARKLGGMVETAMVADRFDAQLMGTGDGLSHLHGEGKTELRQAGADGAIETSHGDVMDAVFHAPAQDCGAKKKVAAKGSPAMSLADEIVSAVQQGHVVMTNLPAKKPGEAKQPEPGRGTANLAEYDGALDRLVLVGDASLANDEMDLRAGRITVVHAREDAEAPVKASPTQNDSASAKNGSNAEVVHLVADRIEMDRATGDAEAQGSVKGSLTQSDAAATKGNDAKVTYVVSDRALFHRGTEVAEFYGSAAGRPARLWQQDGSQVEARVLIFEQQQKVLTARGDGQPAAVHSVFVNAGTDFSQYPLRIKVLSAIDSLPEGTTHPDASLHGQGQADLLLMPGAQGIDFKYDNCPSRVTAGRLPLAAKWTKPGKQLEVFVPSSESTKQAKSNETRFSGCTLDVVMHDYVFLPNKDSALPPAPMPVADYQKNSSLHALIEGSIAESGTNVVRVASRELRYSDADREAVFTGGVEVESADGTMQAQRAEVFLQAAKTQTGAGSKASPEAGMFAGKVERVVVIGGVRIEQPGGYGSGEQLVYTASDGKSVLTGTPAAPPKMVDEQQGTTVTGASLIFHRGDNNVVVSGAPGSPGGSGQRVHTETRVKKK